MPDTTSQDLNIEGRRLSGVGELRCLGMAIAGFSSLIPAVTAILQHRPTQFLTSHLGFRIINRTLQDVCPRCGDSPPSYTRNVTGITAIQLMLLLREQLSLQGSDGKMDKSNSETLQVLDANQQ